MASPQRLTLLRYLALDECLTHGARNHSLRWFKPDLLQAVNAKLAEHVPHVKPIAMRTLEKDLVDMESHYRVIVTRLRDRGRVYYRYASDHDSIHHAVFQSEEAALVQRFMEVMSRFDGMEEWDWWTKARTMLTHRLGLNRTGGRADAPARGLRLAGLGRDDRRWLPVLAKALDARTPVHLSYAPGMGELTERTSFLPCRILEQHHQMLACGNAWDAEGQTWFRLILGLGEVTAVDHVAVEWPETGAPETSGWSAYVDNRMGIEPGVVHDFDASPQPLRVWVEKRLAQTFLKEPMHASQDLRIEQAASGVIFTLHVVPNLSFERFALQWGDRFQVLEPAQLRHAFREQTRSLSSRYAPMFGP